MRKYFDSTVYIRCFKKFLNMFLTHDYHNKESYYLALRQNKSSRIIIEEENEIRE